MKKEKSLEKKKKKKIEVLKVEKLRRVRAGMRPKCEGCIPGTSADTNSVQKACDTCYTI